MSRSYRKPWCTDGYKGSSRKQAAKKEASRRIRRLSEDIPDGGAYRKFYCSWNICDYRFPMFEACVRLNRETGELGWVYEEKPWRVTRK